MSFKPIASPRLYQRIADEIASLIDSGSFKPGERLPAERELAQKMQVSRSSLREALSSLEMSRHVEIRLGSGVYVRAGRRKKAQPSADHASPFDVLRARRLVEGETAALAAKNATPS
ncbi:MAG: FadR family transcriptional regulator, partial [Betaproteobacteria bacterium]|nr:FadR family transcriptional regulator [Betaproteobacteria bacterium]